MPRPVPTFVQSAFTAVVTNETSVAPDPSTYNRGANSIRPPNPDSAQNGRGGWTFGYIQSDFRTNPAQAGNVLSQALGASGYADPETANAITQALKGAGSSQHVNFVDGEGNPLYASDGTPVTLNTLNAALRTPDAMQATYDAGLDAFAHKLKGIEDNIINNPNVQPAVADAFADPVTGPLLITVIADYDNQYNASAGGKMTALLNDGSATFGGGQVTLDTTSAQTVTESVMSAVMSTTWVQNGNARQAEGRLAEDVASAYAYAQANGAPDAFPGDLNVSSPLGNGVISVGDDGSRVEFGGDFGGKGFNASRDVPDITPVVDDEGDPVPAPRGYDWATDTFDGQPYADPYQISYPGLAPGYDPSYVSPSDSHSTPTPAVPDPAPTSGQGAEPTVDPSTTGPTISPIGDQPPQAPSTDPSSQVLYVVAPYGTLPEGDLSSIPSTLYNAGLAIYAFSPSVGQIPPEGDVTFTSADAANAYGDKEAVLIAENKAAAAATASFGLSAPASGDAPALAPVEAPGAGAQFVFQAHEAATFLIQGSSHDTLTLPKGDFADIADVLHHTTQTSSGVVIHDPASGGAMQLLGVTKAELAHHRGDLALG